MQSFPVYKLLLYSAAGCDFTNVCFK